jgi:transposase
MPIVPPTPAPTTPGSHFAPVPWHDQHPERLALEQLLDPDHLARRIEAAVPRLDLRALFASYGGTGSEAYRPDLLLRAVLFLAQRGRHSPATWHRDARECGPLRWLLRGCRPSRACWYAFRDRLAPLLVALHPQPLAQAIAQGLTPAARGAADGTLVAANASRHRLLNEATLGQRVQQLAAVLAAPPAAVAPPEPAAAPPPAPGWMAKSSAGRQAQLRRLRHAQQQLARRQQRNRAKRPSKQTAPARLVIAPADAEAALGLDKEKVFRPLYNVQVVDDLDSPFVLGYGVFAQPNDAGLLGAVLAGVQAAVGQRLRELLADTGYAGGADLKAARAARVTVYAPLPKEGGGKVKQLPKSAFTWLAAEQTYVCPQGQRLVAEGRHQVKRSGPEHVVVQRFRCPGEYCVACPVRAACAQKPAAGRTVHRSEHEEEIEALRQRMGAEQAKALYKQRRQTVELVNADWKTHRQLRRFSGRGLARARCQVGLIVLAHNLLTLGAEERKAQAAAAAVVSPAVTAT